MKYLLSAVLLAIATSVAFSQSESSPISSNAEVTFKLLEPISNLRKVQVLLEERQAGHLPDQGVNIGGSLIAIADYQSSTDDSKFAYLMRHPTSNNQIGKQVSEAVLHSFQLGLTASVNSWMAAHVELLYDPQQSFGAGTITALDRNQLQLRKGYILLGDLNKSPLYGALGKMDLPFGQTGSVNPFSNSTVWHAFGGLAYGAQIGYKKDALEITAMAVQGGAQFRAANTPVAGTNVPSMLNNFVADVNYTLSIGSEASLKVGGSYLHGSAYCQPFPVVHFMPCEEENPAVTGYGKLKLNDNLTVKGSYAQTLNEWPGTHNPAPPLDVFEASKVFSKDVGVRYVLDVNAPVQWSVSGEFSDFRAGPDGAPWERQNQYTLGGAGLWNGSSKLFVELFRTEGYAPLNFISGSEDDNPFPAGTTHSKADVVTHGIVLGGLFTF
jgi:hypothetical protein